MEKSPKSSNMAELKRKNSTVTQQWLENLQNLQNHQMNHLQNTSYSNMYAPQQSLMSRQRQLLRDNSIQSDDSHCSSVESVLELRKPDPEEVLLSLGFGPRRNSHNIGRIPARFLQPSRLIPQIDINEFLERYAQNSADLPQSIPNSPVHLKQKN
ncbi:protein ITPRID2 isoform X1 [Euwallacea fornicatus]|uniref:protein ITPRID2 isoform X1 n=2 Tax=Euwallacea fornicatus TaxID=995702 RepID=UPI00338F3BF4